MDSDDSGSGIQGENRATVDNEASQRTSRGLCDGHQRAARGGFHLKTFPSSILLYFAVITSAYIQTLE